MPLNDERPKVGIGVMIMKDGRVLMGKRRNAHGDGHYSFTGGHLEAGETFEDCARRETLEEAGIEIANIRFLCVGNVRAYGKHYVGVGMLADWASGEPENREPHKREGWDWHDPLSPPEPVFEMSGHMLESWRTKRLCHDGEAAPIEYGKPAEILRGKILAGKLVRDRIPDIIRENDGREAKVRVAEKEEYRQLLAAKLVEEAREYAESGDPKELADLLEVLEAAAFSCGLDRQALEALRRAKAEERGGFEKRIVLEQA